MVGSVGEPIEVGIFWDELAHDETQLGRIAEASGAPPLIWDGQTPAPMMQALIADSPPATVPEVTPRLRLLQCVSAGIDWLREHPVWRSEVAIATASGVHGVPISEHVFALLLALRRELPRSLAAQRNHEWAHEAPPLGELYGLTMGLVGYGHIGRAVAHLARAFGMRVLACAASAIEPTPLVIPGAAPFVDAPALPEREGDRNALLPLTELDEVLGSSDVVVVCAPLTPATQGLLGDAALARLKPGSYLINIARGKIVDEEALVRALRDGRLAGAGLDVTAHEPLPAESPLWDLPNVIVTPHVSGDTVHYVERTVNIFVANLACLRRGEPPLTAVERRRGY